MRRHVIKHLLKKDTLADASNNPCGVCGGPCDTIKTAKSKCAVVIDGVYMVVTCRQLPEDVRVKTSSEIKHSKSNAGGNGAVVCPVCRPEQTFWSPRQTLACRSRQRKDAEEAANEDNITEAERQHFTVGPARRKRKPKDPLTAVKAKGGRKKQKKGKQKAAPAKGAGGGGSGPRHASRGKR